MAKDISKEITRLEAERTKYQEAIKAIAAKIRELKGLPPMINTQPWTPEEHGKLLNLRAEGKTNREMGEIFGLTASRITERMKVAERVFTYLQRKSDQHALKVMKLTPAAIEQLAERKRAKKEPKREK